MIEWTLLAQQLPLVLAYLAGVSLSGAVIWKKVVKPTVNHFRNHSKLSDQVEYIFQQVKPNGGTSIKDSLVRIEALASIASERQKAILHDATAAIIETNPQGKCIWVNRTFTKLVQRTPAEVIGYGWFNVIAPEDREIVMKNWKDSVSQDIEYFTEFNFITLEGTRIPVKFSSYKMINKQNVSIGYVIKINSMLIEDT